MAVFEFKDGQFSRLADSFDEFDQLFKAWDRTVAEYAQSSGMRLIDDVEGVYQLFSRGPHEESFSRVRKYRWWFHLPDVVDVMDDVLIADNLPDFLAFMGLVKPLVDRMAAIKLEIQEETQ